MARLSSLILHFACTLALMHAALAGSDKLLQRARCNYTADTTTQIGRLMDLYKVDRSFDGLQSMVSKLDDSLPGNSGSPAYLRAHFLRLATEAGDSFGTDLELMITALYPYVSTYHDCLVPPPRPTDDAPVLFETIPR